MLSTMVLGLLLPVLPQVSFGVDVNLEVAVPTVRFEVEPPLVVVAPGVVVVRDYDREVFFADGFYWTSSRGVWYRTRSYRGGWVATSSRYVPGRIARVRHGSYRHFRGGRNYDRRSEYGRRNRRDVHRSHDGHDRRDVRDHRDGGRGRRHSERGDRRRGRR